MLHRLRKRYWGRRRRSLDLLQRADPREVIREPSILSLRSLPQLHLSIASIALRLAVYRSVRDVNDPAELTVPFISANCRVRVSPRRGRR